MKKDAAILPRRRGKPQATVRASPVPQSPQRPVGESQRPPPATSRRAFTLTHSEHSRHRPHTGKGPLVIHSRFLSGSQQGVQSTPQRSGSSRRFTDLRAGASYPHLVQRTSRLALAATAPAVGVVLVDRLPPTVLGAPIGPPRQPAGQALKLALLDVAATN